jgi:CMP-N-acetylneuraminic acid synthetase/spore coat polysaccharide biosynthesis predicted glycosyltransferase SpsG
MSTNVLIIIPARGGSKGIPRKNLRLLSKKPLIFYSIKTALKSVFKPTVFVTTEDSEIELISNKFGAKIHKRPHNLSDDHSTLDPVIFDAYEYISKFTRKKFDIVVTLQPTSPLLSVKSLDKAIEKIILNPNIDTIISVKNDTHLSWTVKDNVYYPNYESRVNRQHLKPVYTETGAFLITRSENLTNNNRIGKNVDLYILENGEDIDIDTFNDWNLCEYLLKRKKILFVVAGNSIIGLGHVFNTLIVANDILEHEIEFLVPKGNKLAYDLIISKNYNVKMQKHDSLIKDIIATKPSFIINDILDTSLDYMSSLKKMNIPTINFEDLGLGSKLANLVFNPIYPEKKRYKNHYYGESFFILRDEFIFNNISNKVNKKVNNILITYGGVDPLNLTSFTLKSIYDYCLGQNIEINIITGPGYQKHDSISKYTEIKTYKYVKNISDHMLKADMVFTSAGRTIYEVASLGTPAIVIAQNERELSHYFASEKNGFINLGLGNKLHESVVLEEFKKYIVNYEFRKTNSNLMTSNNLKSGRENVVSIIKQLIRKT